MSYNINNKIIIERELDGLLKNRAILLSYMSVERKNSKSYASWDTTAKETTKKINRLRQKWRRENEKY